MFKGQSTEMRVPCSISLDAAVVLVGVRRFSMPSWSLVPQRPHALPWGPSLRRGRESKEGRDLVMVNWCWRWDGFVGGRARRCFVDDDDAGSRTRATGVCFPERKRKPLFRSACCAVHPVLDLPISRNDDSTTCRASKMREVLLVPIQMLCINNVNGISVVDVHTLGFLVKYILTWKNPHFPNGSHVTRVMFRCETHLSQFIDHLFLP